MATTRALAASAAGDGYVATKSNDHGGEMTTAASALSDPCTWSKAAWLRAEVEAVLRGPLVSEATGERGARPGAFVDLQ